MSTTNKPGRFGDNRPAGDGEWLEGILRKHGLPFGREDSFKMEPGVLIKNRVLVGAPIGTLDRRGLFEIASDLGVPPAHHDSLERHLPLADSVFLGLEQSVHGTVYKMYLQFWEALKRRVLASGSSSPQVLHLGFKWNVATGACWSTQYVCHPLLSASEIVDRIHGIYADCSPSPAFSFSVRALRLALARAPGDALIYLEVDEEGTPRKSCDVNVYPAGMTVADTSPLLVELAHAYGICDPLTATLGRVGGQLLGHLSSGRNSRGKDYVAVYYETIPLPGVERA